MVNRNFDPPDWLPALSSRYGCVRMVEANRAEAKRLAIICPEVLTEHLDTAQRAAGVNGTEAFVIIRIVP